MDIVIPGPRIGHLNFGALADGVAFKAGTLLFIKVQVKLYPTFKSGNHISVLNAVCLADGRPASFNDTEEVELIPARVVIGD